jgi:hypothetical protein
MKKILFVLVLLAAIAIPADVQPQAANVAANQINQGANGQTGQLMLPRYVPAKRFSDVEAYYTKYISDPIWGEFARSTINLKTDEATRDKLYGEAIAKVEAIKKFEALAKDFLNLYPDDPKAEVILNLARLAGPAKGTWILLDYISEH